MALEFLSCLDFLGTYARFCVRSMPDIGAGLSDVSDWCIFTAERTRLCAFATTSLRRKYGCQTIAPTASRRPGKS
jgi:hypothetical protein